MKTLASVGATFFTNVKSSEVVLLSPKIGFTEDLLMLNLNSLRVGSYLPTF
jgi:hypothetical protein